jgi:DNA-binding GntR family transcriptional regulator
LAASSISIGEIKPLRERIADSIRANIIDGRLRPGERLAEPETARRLGVSRTPLREAFLQLVAEGFVELLPRRGVIVSDLSLRDAEETYSVKGVLEALAARLAARAGDPLLLQALDGVTRQIETSAEDAGFDLTTILTLNNAFHQTLTEGCGNRKLAAIITGLRRQTLRYNFLYLSAPPRLRQSLDEHHAILASLRNRDEQRIERLVRAHNDAALQALRAIMLQQSRPSTTASDIQS